MTPKTLKGRLGILALAGLITGSGFAFASSLAPQAAHATTTYYVNESTNTNVSASSQATASVDCNTGDVATGGGVLQNFISEPSPDLVVLQSFPVESSGSAFGWSGTYYNSSGSTLQFVVYVDCVTP